MKAMEPYIWVFILIGAIGIALPWLRKLERTKFLNIPVVAVVLGFLIYKLPLDLPAPDPLANNDFILHLTEFTVIISLMGAGLKMNRNFSLRGYRVPLMLILITMIGCIFTTAALGWWFGLVPASALLLGAVFAPTDPVLSGEIQVKLEESEADEHPVKFNLTAEAGLNDGLAFPFTWLAILVAIYGLHSDEWTSEWLWRDVLYRIAAGVGIGFLLGKVIGWLFFRKLRNSRFISKRLSLVGIAITLLVYGMGELAHAYGFISVFVAALVIRHQEKEHEFHVEIHDVVEQVEHFVIVLSMLLLGAYISYYHFDYLTLPMMGLCLLFIFFIRPAFGILPMLKSELPWRERWSVAFLGIKGVGSFFYLAFALHEAEFAQSRMLWDSVAFLVVISLVVHGILVYYVNKRMI